MTAPTAATGERNRARIVEGGHTVVGGLEKEIIRRVVRVNLNQVRYCFEKQLTKDPRLAGKLVLKWVVEPDGTVGAVTVQKTTFANEALSSCITSRVRRWRFPKPEGGGTVTVTYPFNFSPK